MLDAEENVFKSSKYCLNGASPVWLWFGSFISLFYLGLKALKGGLKEYEQISYSSSGCHETDSSDAALLQIRRLQNKG